VTDTYHELSEFRSRKFENVATMSGTVRTRCCDSFGEIVSRRLLPGTVLKDAEVAARLGVSITPVREAIGQLAAEGLVDIAPNRTRTSPTSPRDALELAT